MTAPVPPGGPLRLTRARWCNRIASSTSRDRSTGLPAERWHKVLAHRGPYTQFAYGTDTPSEWSGPLQRCIICYPLSGVIGIDVDDEAEYLTTGLAAFIRREHAISTRGGDHWHALIDARSVPPGLWPRQGEIRGANGLHAADIKSNGFIPVPGCTHYTRERYEPVLHPGGTAGTLHIVTCTPEILAAIEAGRQVPAANGGGPGGSGGGHDGEIAAHVLGWVRQGLGQEEIYAQWLKIAIPQDSGWPFTHEDFGRRHYRTAVAKARREDAAALKAYESWNQFTGRRP